MDQVTSTISTTILPWTSLMNGCRLNMNMTSTTDNLTLSACENSSNINGFPLFNQAQLDILLRQLLKPSNLLPEPLSHGLIVTLIVLYCLVIVVAVIGNSAVIFVIIKHHTRRSVTDMYILSLAVNDLLIATLNMHFQLHYVTTNEWLAAGTRGEALCKFTNYIQGVTIVSCVLTLTSIAIDRYIVICRPVLARRFHSKRTAKIAILVVWFIALCALSPHLVFQRLDKRLKITESSITYGWVCAEFYPHGKHDGQLYFVFIYVTMYCIPVTVMAFTYGAIAHRLWFKHLVFPANENTGQNILNIAHKKKITKLLIILVLSFTILWSPIFTLSVYSEFSDITGRSYRVKLAVLQFIAYSNCCVNPIMYTFLNNSFQSEFIRLCKICFRNRKELSHSCKTDTESKM